MQRYFDEVGLVAHEHHVRVFDELDDALEWVEDRILEAAAEPRDEETPLELREMDLFAGRKEETLGELEACMEARTLRAGERIFAHGDHSDELYLIRRGAVRIVLPFAARAAPPRHLRARQLLRRDVVPGPRRRSADAVAFADTDLFVLSRERFDAVTAITSGSRSSCSATSRASWRCVCATPMPSCARCAIQRSAGARARSKIFERESLGR